MKNISTFIKNKLALLLAVIVAAIIGGATTAVVMAAVPDSNGVIHGCRTTATGAIKVIDSGSQSCNGFETALDWDQGNSNGSTWGHINADGSIDTTNSKNIIASAPSIYSAYIYCLQIGGSPKNVEVTTEAPSANTYAYIRGLSGQDSVIDEYCGSETNVLVSNYDGVNSGFFISLNQ